MVISTVGVVGEVKSVFPFLKTPYCLILINLKRNQLNNIFLVIGCDTNVSRFEIETLSRKNVTNWYKTLSSQSFYIMC
jgi:hypothetical protein